MQMLRLIVLVAMTSACQSPRGESALPDGALTLSMHRASMFMHDQPVLDGASGTLGITWNKKEKRHYSLELRAGTFGIVDAWDGGMVKVETGDAMALETSSVGFRVSYDVLDRLTVGAGLGFGHVFIRTAQVEEDVQPLYPKQPVMQLAADVSWTIKRQDVGLVKSMAVRVGATGSLPCGSGELAMKGPMMEVYAGIDMALIPGDGLIDYKAFRFDEKILAAMALTMVFIDIPSGIVYFLAAPVHKRLDAIL